MINPGSDFYFLCIRRVFGSIVSVKYTCLGNFEDVSFKCSKNIEQMLNLPMKYY